MTNKKVIFDFENALEEAIQLQQNWQFDEAEKKYQDILAKNPDEANALHNLGVLYAVQLMRPQDAFPYFEAALNIEPTRLQFWFSYMDALIKNGDAEMAEQVLGLAKHYGLNDLQVASLERDIFLAKAQVMDWADKILEAGAPFVLPKVEKKPTSKKPVGKDPSLNKLQELLGLFNQKKFAEAVKLGKKLLSQYPASVPVLTILAECHEITDASGDYIHALELLAKIQPDSAGMQLRLSKEYIKQEDEKRAEEIIFQVLNNDLKNAEAHAQLGLLQNAKGNKNAALISYARALKKEPQNPLYLEKFAGLLQAQGDEDGALTCFKAAVQASPDSADLMCAYGVTLKNRERLAAAENAFRKALLIDPGHKGAMYGLCNLLEIHGRFEEAEAGLKLFAEIDNESPETLFEIGRNLSQQKRDKEALDWLRRAIKAKPDYVAAHIILSAALSAAEEPEKAIEEIQKSIEQLPNIPHLYTNLGVVNLALSKADEAIACFRKALEINPNFSHARSSMLFALSHSTKITPEELYREHRTYGRLIEAEVADKVYKTHPNERDPSRPLRVGFVSADFRNHAVAQFVTPFFEELNKYPEIITYAYSNHGAVDDAMLAIKKNMDVWRTVVQWSDDKLAKQIREDRIDILVDLSGHTGGDRLKVFARKPAPVQVTWLGYPGTTGLKAMDYRLIDIMTLKPEGSKNLYHQFTEKLVFYPPSFTFKKIEEDIDAGAAPCLANGYLTFGSFNRLNKISREVVVTWCSILKAVPNSRLIMGAMPYGGAPDEIKHWFLEEGIMDERIEFHPRTNLIDYLKLYAQVDLCLDTFPYTGGTTTLHALWMGVPTLTIAGDTYPGRQSSQIIYSTNMELGHQCVARYIKDIPMLAKNWAEEPELLNIMRRKLQAAYAEQGDISGPQLAVRSKVYAMRKMWESWCSGQKNKSFIIDYKDIGVSAPNFSL